MQTDQYGRVEITDYEAFNALYTGKILTINGINIVNVEDIDQYNHAHDTNADRIPVLEKLKELNINIEIFDKTNQTEWFMPDDYCPNLVEMLYSMCTTTEQTNRVSEELELFIQYNMMDLLFYLKYLVDTLRENKVMWGVGRGSSVASYVLYLIGVHKIDSLKFSLDIKEFLK